jgi:hypothetical protein
MMGLRPDSEGVIKVIPGSHLTLTQILFNICAEVEELNKLVGRKGSDRAGERLMATPARVFTPVPGILYFETTIEDHPPPHS